MERLSSSAFSLPSAAAPETKQRKVKYETYKQWVTSTTASVRQRAGWTEAETLCNIMCACAVLVNLWFLSIQSLTN